MLYMNFNVYFLTLVQGQNSMQGDRAVIDPGTPESSKLLRILKFNHLSEVDEDH